MFREIELLQIKHVTINLSIGVFGVLAATFQTEYHIDWSTFDKAVAKIKGVLNLFNHDVHCDMYRSRVKSS